MKRILRSAVSLLLCAAVALGGTACGRSKLPTTITIWTYYNGDQLECFNQLVEQFNSTVGKEKNIRVESSSQGSVNDLETSVLAAAEGGGCREAAQHRLLLRGHRLYAGSDGPCR